MGYKKKIIRKGMRNKTVYIETVDTIDSTKGRIRQNIHNEVSDRDTLIADLFKLNFLTISALKAVYDCIDTSEMPENVKELLDVSFAKYDNTKTIMDLYIENNDFTFIDRMLERQAKITEIVEKG